MAELFEKTYQSEELDDEIAVIRGSIWDNCRDWCYKCEKDIKENTEKRELQHCPHCNRILGFLARAGIDEYLKTLDPEERETRESGVWRHLSGLVYKELSYTEHLYEDFNIPSAWMKIEALDPHDARASCWLFGAVSPEEIEIFGKVRHRIYFYDYIFSDTSIEDLARQVFARRGLHGYKDPVNVVLDAKWGAKENMRALDSDTTHRTWQSELERAGIRRIKLSQSGAGDVELGHKIVRQYLKPHYSKVTQTSKPGILFAKRGCGGVHSPIQYMFSYIYDEKTGKPEEKFKDFPDCVRYIGLEMPVYREPEAESNMIINLTDRRNQAINSRRMAIGHGR